jgi:hypothetical protein
LVEGLLAISGFGDDGDVFLGSDHRCYASAGKRLVIDYNNSDHAGTFP